MKHKLVPKGTKICPSCPGIKPQNTFNFGTPVMKKKEETTQVISVVTNPPKKRKGVRGLF